MAKILVIEDERDFAEALSLCLSAERHSVEIVGTIASATDRLKFYHYDVVLLDLGLPDGSGIEICKTYRDGGGTTPFIILSGKNEMDSKLVGLDVGADDYVTKPCHTEELLARIRAVLRRPAHVRKGQVRIGSLELDESAFTVTVDGEEVKLQAKEFALLNFFMRHPNQVFSPSALLDRVWSSESDTSTDVVKVYVNKLRNKLALGKLGLDIVSIRGLGYKLECDKEIAAGDKPSNS